MALLDVIFFAVHFSYFSSLCFFSPLTFVDLPRSICIDNSRSLFFFFLNRAPILVVFAVNAPNLLAPVRVCICSFPLVRYTEFLAATVEAKGLNLETELLEAFDRMDADDSGFISEANLRELLGTAYKPNEVRRREAEEEESLGGGGGEEEGEWAAEGGYELRERVKRSDDFFVGVNTRTLQLLSPPILIFFLIMGAPTYIELRFLLGQGNDCRS